MKANIFQNGSAGFEATIDLVGCLYEETTTFIAYV
jgi:hypothetical protein